MAVTGFTAIGFTAIRFTFIRFAVIGFVVIGFTVVRFTVTGFTVITIIFAPIAFVTTLFALPFDVLLRNQFQFSAAAGISGSEDGTGAICVYRTRCVVLHENGTTQKLLIIPAKTICLNKLSIFCLLN